MLNHDRSGWHESPWREIPPLADHIETDVCVVGLGGSGLTCINRLLALGKKVVGIDADTVGGGAAGRNGGFLLAGAAPFYHDLVKQLGRERARALYQLTLDEIDQIESSIPAIVRRLGSLRIAGSVEEQADCMLQYEAMRADGFPVELYDGPEGVGLLIPSDASFNPLMRCRLLASEAIENGARLFEHSRAVSIEGGSVTTDGGGTITSDKIIVAVDGNLESIFPELHGRVRTARLQMLATEPVPENVVPRPVYFRYGYDYWQQLPNGRVFVGGARDSESDAEWTTDTQISDGIQKQLDDLLRNRIGVSQAVTHRWAALVSYTEDEMPLLEEVRPGVIAIGAYSGTGNVMGALYGRRAADIATAMGDEPRSLTEARRFLLF